MQGVGHIQEALSGIGVDLLIQTPYLGTLFTEINRIIGEEGLPDIGWTVYQDRPALSVQPAWWVVHQKEVIQFLRHELAHLLLEHPVQSSQFSNAFLYNVAVDWQLQTIAPNPLQPDFDCLQSVSQVEEASLPSLYHYLEDIWFKAPPSNKQKTGLLKLYANRQHYFESHKDWRKTATVPLAQLQYQALAKQQHPYFIQGKGGAAEPELATVLQTNFQTDQRTLDWRKVLHFFAQSSKRTYLQHTVKKTSKRYGTRPGTRIRHRTHLLVAIDTSASITEATFSLFFSALHQLWLEGLTLEVVSCDTTIRQHFIYKGQPPSLVKGRGGTSFLPVFAWAEQRVHLDGLIYFTDGKGAPPLKTPVAALLWVLSPDGISPATMQERGFPGRLIQLPKSSSNG